MTDQSLDTACAALVARFRRQRPLRGGSLLVTIFGDSLAPRGGAVTLGSLIRLAAAFGLNERLVRTAAARLVGEGWLENRRVGRLSEYRPSPAGRTRFAAAARQIYAENPHTWSGRWTLVVLPASLPRGRDELRQALRWSGYGEPRPGLFAHPAQTVAQAEQQIAAVVKAPQVLVFESTTGGAAADRALAAAGWDLDELARRYRRFIKAFAPVQAATGSRAVLSPATAFTIRTLLVHEYRKIQLRCPPLPGNLLPAGWVGASAYTLCRDLYAHAFAAAERHLDQTGACLAGPLPAPEADTYGRFGGLPRP